MEENHIFNHKVQLTLSALLAAFLVPLQPLKAQQITAAQDGTGTIVTTNGTSFEINGGSLSQDGRNLFHSFQEFGLNANQIANFLSNPQILNILSRVNGGNPSIIDGLIQVTGGNSNLYIVNPAGIIFGANGRLNLGGDFTATTATRIGFGDNEFNAFEDNNYFNLIGNPDSFFFSNSAGIINRGELNLAEGRNLTLMGSTVLNQGTLGTASGNIIVAAVPGEKLLRITQPGHLLSLEISLEDLEDNVFPITSEQILDGIKGTAIVSGTLDTSGAIGGDVLVVGETIELDSANINARGIFGGGDVFIGGNRRGAEGLPTAANTSISGNSRIYADALQYGDGGNVTIFSDSSTVFSGQISAQGGSLSGNGGFVEVSGKEQLLFSGNVDVGAVEGTNGTILLDPRDIRIVANDDSANDNELGDGEILSEDGGNQTDFTISDTALTALIGNIILEADRDITAEDNTNLTFNNQTSGSTITFTAGRNIEINTGIITAGGNLELTAENGSITLENVETFVTDGNGGNVQLAAGENIQVRYISTQGGTNGVGGNVDLTAGQFFQATETFIDGNGLDASISTRGGLGGGEIRIVHGGNDDIPFEVGNATINGTAGVITTGGTTIQLGSPTTTVGNIEIIQQEAPQLPLPEPLPEPLPLPEPPPTPETELFRANPPIPPVDTNKIAVEIEATTLTSDLLARSGISPFLLNSVEKVDREFSKDFEEYLGITSSGNITLKESQGILRQIESSTGTEVKPALIYSFFSPTSNELKLVLVTPTGTPIERTIEGVTRQKVVKVAKRFRKYIGDGVSELLYKPAAKQLYQWLIAPLEEDLAALEIDNLVFVMDAGLRAIPLAALHDGDSFIIEKYSVGLMPSISLTDTSYRPLKDMSVLAMGATTFTDQKSLPAVPLELEVITKQLWSGQSFLDATFTVENLKEARSRQPYGIVHLATHAEFTKGNPSNSYIQFGSEKVGLNQLRTLGLHDPTVELMVLSACRTALGDLEAELGFAGLAHQAGVKTILGSLWYVSDAGTLGLMTQFYEELKAAPIKAEALRQAQLAMLKGEVVLSDGKLITSDRSLDLPPSLAEVKELSLTHPYFWSSFTMVGNPW